VMVTGAQMVLVFLVLHNMLYRGSLLQLVPSVITSGASAFGFSQAQICEDEGVVVLVYAGGVDDEDLEQRWWLGRRCDCERRW